MTNPAHPYWGKALQNQQKSQAKPEARQASKRQQPQPARQRDDFGDDWRGKYVVTKVVEGSNVNTIEGVVEDVSRYWLKVRVGNDTIYLNKAHIVSIKPAEMKDGQGGPNAGGQSARQ